MGAGEAAETVLPSSLSWTNVGCIVNTVKFVA